MFTPEELAEMAAADAEIDAEFRLTQDDLDRSKEFDRFAKFDALPSDKQKVASQKRAWYEANREKLAAQQRAYREANREKYNAYMREYYRKRRSKNWHLRPKLARDGEVRGGTDQGRVRLPRHRYLNAAARRRLNGGNQQ